MNIKFVIFDYDGIFSNGDIIFNDNNEILKKYNIKDGYGLNILKKNNIKIGLLSNFNSNKELKFNEKSIDNFKEHLDFDYFYIGTINKLEILNLWKNELNINYNEIAYIGDDMNDIEILEKVGLSACPSDAIEECKQIVNYICDKNGGDGCVREFVELIINDNYKEQNIIQEIKKEVNYQLDNIQMDKINIIINKIKDCSGIIYTSGIGKSENIACHLANLLKSISIKSFFLNTINSTHGDMGTICYNDIIILFSKSGKTKELIEIIPFLKQRNCYIIGICNDVDNTFANECNYNLILPFKKEITGELNKIPSNSYMSHLLFINIIVGELKKNINLDQYKQNHPAGSIGTQLKKIADYIIVDFPKIILKDNIKLHDILLEMTKYKIGCCFFVDENNILLGILTDGDIRRLLINNDNLKEINFNIINKNFYWEQNLNKYMFDCKKYSYIPILNNNQIIGIIN